MIEQFKRRDFLRGCAAIGGAIAASNFSCIEIAKAAAIDDVSAALVGAVSVRPVGV